MAVTVRRIRRVSADTSAPAITYACRSLCVCIVRFLFEFAVCHLLGDYHESLNKDFEKAADIYKNNCDNLDYGRSCAKFGGYKLIGKEGFPIPTIAVFLSRPL